MFAWTVDTIFSGGIKVLRHVAVDAGLPIPEEILRTLAGVVDLDLPSLAPLTCFESGVPKSSQGTGGALLPIKVRIFGRAVDALPVPDGVNLVVRAGLTGLIVEVKVLRMEAFDALAAVIEVKWVVALTHPLRQVELPPVATRIALVGSRVEDLICLAGNASLSVEEWL